MGLCIMKYLSDGLSLSTLWSSENTHDDGHADYFSSFENLNFILSDLLWRNNGKILFSFCRVSIIQEEHVGLL